MWAKLPLTVTYLITFWEKSGQYKLLAKLGPWVQWAGYKPCSPHLAHFGVPVSEVESAPICDTSMDSVGEYT